MKNISSIQKSNKNESPKTPGGISKSLLTPCRRVGLSRNWRKSGSSPFISPLSGTDTSIEVKQEHVAKKRKRPTEEASQEISQNNEKNDDLIETPTSRDTPRITDNDRTPTRLLPRKKSKTLLLEKECEDENIPQISDAKVDLTTNETKKESPKNTKVIKLSRTNSKNSNWKVVKSPMKEKKIEPSYCEVAKASAPEDNSESIQIDCKQKSPDNLTKECIVVIQKKIFKSDDKINNNKLKSKENNPASQVLFDYDSDDPPLSAINKKEKIIKPIIDDDDEFQENKKVKKNLQQKLPPAAGLKAKLDIKQKPKILQNKPKAKTHVETNIRSSQESIELDDDDFVCDKKTILIKKTYDKIPKLTKARSTGSITQKDIDELKERIEAKKNLLLAKAMTNETEELRSLIKKWQKGCQTALTELLELMKAKMPEQRTMEYSEMLQLLKIPPDLVGYDSENDCFNTPDDADIVLSGLNII